MMWLIGIGGSLGACTRYLLSKWIHTRTNKIGAFPISTWIINISGSFLLGILANLYSEHVIGINLWYFAGIGFCGAYTTFSTFGFETLTLIQLKNLKLAILYVVSSFIAGILFATIGFMIIGMK